jgi:hypothetical protein
VRRMVLTYLTKMKKLFIINAENEEQAKGADEVYSFVDDFL